VEAVAGGAQVQEDAARGVGEEKSQTNLNRDNQAQAVDLTIMYVLRRLLYGRMRARKVA